MLCPIDQTELVMADRQGIEIDYCPKCRGVWLDRGELDKLIERSPGPAPVAYPQAAPQPAPFYPPPPHYRDNHGQGGEGGEGGERGYYGQHPNSPRRRKSFLGDIFDF
jgi:uncharacterized protein